jgi:ABC-type branched-subunit amino acid transport system ATPase component
VTALIGSNGAGKSTFLNLLSGLLLSDGGTIRLNGVDLATMPAYRRARAGLGRTFQHPRSFRTFTALDAVIFAQTRPRIETLWRNVAWSLWGENALPPTNAFAENCLAKCRLLHKANTLAAELTYGEQKLLMMAQALAFGGDLICLDELCAGLEPVLSDQVGDLVIQLSREGKTFIFVEHNLEIVRKIADRCIFLHEGIVFREGTTAQVLSDPHVVRLYLGD